MGDKGKGPCENCKAIIDIEYKKGVCDGGEINFVTIFYVA
jgi:hypothetical protein